MTKEDHLLTQVAEECCEIAQRCTKALRFGLEEVQDDEQDNPRKLTNRERIHAEYIDLVAVLALLDANLLVVNTHALTVKQQKVARYLEHAREQGRFSETNGEGNSQSGENTGAE